jgi:hypothetical protein
VSDGSVSRKHARIERRGDQWVVIDQASANGTFIDSQRISESVLRAGQELRFGAVPFRVEIDTHPRPDMSATISPEEGATVIQPILTGGAVPPRPMSPPPPPPRVAPPPPATGPVGAPRAGGPVPPGPVTKGGKSPAFWVATGCCGCAVLIAIILAVVFGGGMFGLFTALEGPKKVINAQLQEIKAGKGDAAYAHLSESYRARLSREDFDALVAAHPAMRDNKESTFSIQNIQNESAHYEGSLTATSGEKEGVTYELTKENGEWKITSIRFAGDVTIPNAGSPETGSPGGGSRLEIETAGLEKEANGTLTVVKIDLVVRGIGTRPASDGYAIDVVQDLETLGPDGSRIASLSKKGLKEIAQSTNTPNASATFNSTLSVPSSFGEGTFTARFTIRDRVAGTKKVHEVPFALP